MKKEGFRRSTLNLNCPCPSVQKKNENTLQSQDFGLGCTRCQGKKTLSHVSSFVYPIVDTLSLLFSCPESGSNKALISGFLTAGEKWKVKTPGRRTVSDPLSTTTLLISSEFCPKLHSQQTSISA